LTSIRDSGRLVYGIGIKGTAYPSSFGSKDLKEYKLWSGMLERCTEKCWGIHPTYIGTTCSENFKSYSYFYEWCHNQIGFAQVDENGKSWHLDKDLLSGSSKVYSEDTCVFIPRAINSLLIKSDASRGDFPLGVSLDSKKHKLIAKCRNGCGVQEYLGMFSSPKEAFQVYKTYKELVIKNVANKYKNLIDERAYQALMNYEVNEND